MLFSEDVFTYARAVIGATIRSMTEVIINKIQADIMRRLHEQDGLRFAEINREKVPSDQFSYHLRQLMKAKIIEKLPDQTYRLTTRGRPKAIMLKPTKNGFIEQGYLAVIVIATKRENDKSYFLIQERDKVPYKNTIACLGDKIYYSEEVQTAAERAFQAQTGLSGDIQLRSIWHLKDVYKGEIVEDKYFYVHIATNLVGTVKPIGSTGKNLWMTLDEIEQSDRRIHGIGSIIRSTQSPQLTFHEETFNVGSY